MVIIILLILALAAWFIWYYINQKYTSFVSDHSLALRELQEINEKYSFAKIENFDMEYSYDNQAFYDTISPKDFLTYQLVFKKKEVLAAIESASENRGKHIAYVDNINKCALGRYDTDQFPTEQDKLNKIENRLFNSRIKKPTTALTIQVCLCLTKINGDRITYKVDRFDSVAIKEIVTKLNQKQGDFYLNDSIWQSICRVERGKVSNKMRFSIYERDGYRCRKCGRATKDLEIDHIFPVSKGGKSTYDNLQTLCHRCNSSKSNTVERGAINPKSAWQGIKDVCENCGAPLVKKRGRYGDFYGCSNYPKCRYTKQITNTRSLK